MNIIEATQSYEDFLSKNIPMVENDLLLKHKQMGQSRFSFLRATYYRWAQCFSEILPELANAPHITALGDLHLENFGTFRDRKNRLIWAINDFDEVDELPYTNDLVRLATSALLAIKEFKLFIKPKKAGRIILDGYSNAIEKEDNITIVEGKNHFVRKTYKEFAKDPKKWWNEVFDLPLTHLTKLDFAALELLNEKLPRPEWHVTLHVRTAGLGSLGHRRFLAIGNRFKNKKQEHVTYELKEMSPPATYWLNNRTDNFEFKVHRIEDHSRKINKTWLIHRLAPDCLKLEFSSLPTKKKEEHLLFIMGQELANFHNRNSDMTSQILNDLDNIKKDWLVDAASKMTEIIDEDWKSWRNSDYFKSVSDI